MRSASLLAAAVTFFGDERTSSRFMLPNTTTSLPTSSLLCQTVASKSVLLVGGTRFSGLYLWRELHKRGHRVTLFNRGKTEIKKIPSETDAEFIDRKANARYILGDRQDIADMSSKLVGRKHHMFALLTPDSVRTHVAFTNCKPSAGQPLMSS